MKPQHYPAIDISGGVGGGRTRMGVIKNPVIRRSNAKHPGNDFLITFRVGGNKFKDILRESVRNIILEELSFFVDDNHQQQSECPSPLVEDLPVLMLNNYSHLTPKETEVMDLVLLDFTNRKIGLRLKMKLSTVKNHIKSINNKFGVKDRKTACIAYRKLYNKPEIMLK